MREDESPGDVKGTTKGNYKIILQNLNNKIFVGYILFWKKYKYIINMLLTYESLEGGKKIESIFRIIVALYEFFPRLFRAAIHG